MAKATFVHEGKSVDYTPGSAVAAGDVILQGSLVGIATSPIPAGTLGALSVSGMFDIAKATGTSTAIAVGAEVYWNAATRVATATASGNTYMGKCIKAAADADGTVRVRLIQ